MPYRRSIVAVIVTVLALFMVSPALAGTGKGTGTDTLTVIPPSASVGVTGMTYGELAAAWQQTMLPIKTTKNPQNGSYPSKAKCQGGNAPQIFFLAGSLNASSPSTPVTRTCTVPSSKPIFFPIINGECSSLEQPPFQGLTDDARTACAKMLIDGVPIDSLKVTLDGVLVPNLGSFRAASPPYNFTVPKHNTLGVTGPTGGRSVTDGFWVLLSPPAPGNHVIHFEATVTSGPASGFSQFVTYNLTVK